MAKELSLDDVRRVARLARVGIEEAELERLRDDLGAVLATMAALDELDDVLRDVEPTFYPVAIAAPLRPDEETPCLPRREALAAAPKVVDDGFAVPRVLEGH